MRWVRVNMKGTDAGGVQSYFPVGRHWLCVHGAITSSHSSNVSANTLPALKPKAAFDYIQALLYAQWNGKTEPEWQSRSGYTSPYRLQHLLRAIWDEREQMCAEVRLCSRASG